MDSENSRELESLLSFYEDIPRHIVVSVWNKNDHDYKICMEELAEISRNPEAAVSPSLAQPTGREITEEASSLRLPQSHETVEVDYHGSPTATYSRTTPPSQFQDETGFAWDNLWKSVSDSIIAVADNISEFVSDLASAVDAGWDGEEDQQTSEQPSQRRRDKAAVVHGGSDSQRVNNRRQQHTGVGHSTTTEERRDSDCGGDESKYD